MTNTTEKIIALSTPATQDQINQIHAIKVVREMNQNSTKGSRTAERTIKLWRDGFAMSNEEIEEYATRFPGFENVEEYLKKEGE